MLFIRRPVNLRHDYSNSTFVPFLRWEPYIASRFPPWPFGNLHELCAAVYQTFNISSVWLVECLSLRRTCLYGSRESGVTEAGLEELNSDQVKEPSPLKHQPFWLQSEDAIKDLSIEVSQLVVGRIVG